jgi:hypothetical protein
MVPSCSDTFSPLLVGLQHPRDLYTRVSSEEQQARETIEIQGDFPDRYRSLYQLEAADI